MILIFHDLHLHVGDDILIVRLPPSPTHDMGKIFSALSLFTFNFWSLSESAHFQVVTTEIPSRSTSVDLHFHHFCGELLSIMSIVNNIHYQELPKIIFIIKSCPQLDSLSRAAHNYFHYQELPTISFIIKSCPLLSLSSSVTQCA